METAHVGMVAGHWQSRFDLLAREYGVPGAAFGVVRLAPERGEERLELATGSLHLGTGVPATRDSPATGWSSGTPTRRRSPTFTRT